MDDTLSSLPCPTLFTEGYGRDSEEMKCAQDLMQIEIVLSEVVRTIETEGSLSEFLRESRVCRRLFERGSVPQGIFPSGVPESNGPGVMRNACCNRCGHNRYTIEARGNGMDFLEYRHMGDLHDDTAAELICQSCCYEGGVSCIDCGMSEHFALNQGLPRFMEDTEVWPRNWRCDGCWARMERYNEGYVGVLPGGSIDLMECEHCGRIWDGNAQCPCLLEEEPGTPPIREGGDNLPYEHTPETDIGEWIIDPNGDLSNIDDYEGDYEGEYENEELPENNTEKVRAVKDTVKKIGEIVFDIQEDISEGVYLQLMDNLQELTNRVNEL